MAKKRRVVWTETAAKQRNHVLRFWVENNKSNLYSIKLLELSNEKAELISKNPEIYRKSEFPDTRVASMGHYSMYYKVDSGVIIITAFWDNRQDPGKLLELLQ